MADMREKYENLHLAELKQLAKERGLKGVSTAKKAVIIEKLLTLDAEEFTEKKIPERKEIQVKNEAPVEKEAPVDKTVPVEKEVPAEKDVPEENTASEEQEAPAENEQRHGEHRYDPRRRYQNSYQRSSQNTSQNNAQNSSQNRNRNDDESLEVTGIYEPVPEKDYGFLRSENFISGDNDVYVSNTQIRKFDLRIGDVVTGKKRESRPEDRNAALMFITAINGVPIEQYRRRPRFEHLTPIFPNERIKLERYDSAPATRIVDFISPIGKGQRGMIVSPPKAGKTTLLKDIAKSVLQNHPEMHIIILLIDERPEEVTDMKESIVGDNVEVIYATFDEAPERQIKVAQMVIERARRLVEQKEDVIILLDSITRLARAHNMTVTPSGRTLSGGLDPAALQEPKKFFGAARNMREGGSLTILATALVETGSKMDDVVFEEFKGTGNMELVLDRKLQERRVFPAIDFDKSGTRRDDLLLSKEEKEALDALHRNLGGKSHDEYLENLISLFRICKTNKAVIRTILKK